MALIWLKTPFNFNAMVTLEWRTDEGIFWWLSGGFEGKNVSKQSSLAASLLKPCSALEISSCWVEDLSLFSKAFSLSEERKSTVNRVLWL